MTAVNLGSYTKLSTNINVVFSDRESQYAGRFASVSDRKRNFRKHHTLHTWDQPEVNAVDKYWRKRAEVIESNRLGWESVVYRSFGIPKE